MIADYYSEIKIVIFQYFSERQRDEWRSSQIAGESRKKTARILTA